MFIATHAAIDPLMKIRKNIKYSKFSAVALDSYFAGLFVCFLLSFSFFIIYVVFISWYMGYIDIVIWTYTTLAFIVFSIIIVYIYRKFPPQNPDFLFLLYFRVVFIFGLF